jgi:hypothetical protein
MLRLCFSSSVDHSPATPSIRSASRAVSSLSAAREDVDRDGLGRFDRKLVLGERSEDGLRADYDHGFMADDLARRPDRVFELAGEAGADWCTS